MESDITKLDLYEILGVAYNCNTQEIKKAYRKKALECHPDKNPDNPDAGKLFRQLTQVLEILIDEKARAAYDNVLNARKQTQRRHQELDAKRKKFKEDLEARERDAELRTQPLAKTEEEKLKERIEELRRQSSKELQEEIELMRKQIKKDLILKKSAQGSCSGSLCKLKLKWSCLKSDETNGGYDSDILFSLFSKYGKISAIVISNRKKGSAVVEFENEHSAKNALGQEKGLPGNPLKITPVEEMVSHRNETTFANFEDSRNDAADNDDFEAHVLNLLKRTQERRRQQEN